LSAVASVFAGMVLNRHTRSHTFVALALAAVMFVVFNAGTNYLFQPEFVTAQLNGALEQGSFGVAMFAVGLALVGVIVFVFGVVGILISRLKRENSIGRLVEAARALPAGERDALTVEIGRRLQAAAVPVAAGPEP
jgi:uncharacterized iron-regulated membrane protein